MQKLNVVPRGVRCNLTHWFLVQMISSLIVLQLFRHAVQKYTSGSKKLEAKMTPPHNFSQQSDSESQCYKVHKPQCASKGLGGMCCGYLDCLHAKLHYSGYSQIMCFLGAMDGQ